MKKSLLLCGLLLCGLSEAPVMAVSADPNAWTLPLTPRQQASHALNRLAFGPRPGEVEKLAQNGVMAWVNAQLESPRTQPELEAQIQKLPFLNDGGARLRLAYEGDFGILRKILDQKKQAQNGIANAEAMPAMLDVRAQRQQERAKRIEAEFEAAGLERGSSLQALGELSAAKIARATDSPAQLQEVLTDFWSNHFNVDVRKGPTRVLKIADERDVIRPRVFGKFRDLLGASAKSPAMLWYLDNARSTAEITNRMGKKRGGLNENYARELMELHTLGVDGGYSQTDVTEVARCLTGWSIAGVGQGGPAETAIEFQFRPFAHDRGEKTVLGQKIPAGGGMQDGEKVLDILAAHPSTAKFIARKLCVRFASDNPPASLVEKVAATFTKTDGDLKAVYRTLFTAPEFWSQGAYRSKIKSPFEFAVSSVRALGGNFTVPNPDRNGQLLWLRAIGQASDERTGNRFAKMALRPLAGEIAQMGQPLFACQPPTGWSENSQSWVSASALVSRLNFALSLTSGRVGDVKLQTDTFAPTTLDALSQSMLGGEMTASTRQTIAAETDADNAKLRALVLGSPEFQRR